MFRPDQAFHWRKSSRSNGAGECVEVALNVPGVSVIRDSKAPDGPVLLVTSEQFVAFRENIKSGRLDG